VALVTGAAGGLGRGIADLLAVRGATVVAADLTEPDPASYQRPARVVAAGCDIGNADDVERMMTEAATRTGGIDILVNNAGVFDTITATTRISSDTWDRDIQVNLSGPFYATRLALPHMVERRWGRIINISSMSSHGAYKQATYGATKMALLGLTSTVAMEFAPVGITCNAVLPGLIGTAKALLAPADILDAARATIPAGRLGEVADIAEMVAFLASPAAGYVNGAHIPVDGGTMLLSLRFARTSTFAESAEAQ
jgi:NAD(P)-dependent dehydrogenase (short-subunit alcohol dehydrogenase family)